MRKTVILMLVCAFVSVSISAQTTAFTYQGSLKDGAAAANGNYDFEFALFDAVSGGAQLGTTLPRNTVVVTNGIFSVNLDFGSQFPGANRFLEIRVRLSGQPGITILTPRQQINSDPYSIKSINSDAATSAASATNATQLGGIAANQYVVTTDPRLTDARPPTAGSTNYIQNGASQQGSSNFNISGNGTVGGALSGNSVSATTQYNLGGFRVLSNAGSSNLFVGGLSGASNTGGNNSFIGSGAGLLNTSGFGNTFVGASTGNSNTTGGNNSYFGSDAGRNTTGSGNSFFGRSAGYDTTSGSNNVFVGLDAGRFNTMGSGNTFIGQGAGSDNTTGTNNTFIGANITYATAQRDHATVIGAGANTNGSNTIVLGREDGSDFVIVWGGMYLGSLGTAGSTTLCRNSFFHIATCSSSLRYKTNIGSFTHGLDLVNKLHPITFNWKDGGTRDIGFGAEDVEKVDPLLVTYNNDGQVEGVKYDRLSAAFVNAFKEQQEQIEAQQKEIVEQKDIAAKQQALIEQLVKRLEQLEKKENK